MIKVITPCKVQVSTIGVRLFNAQWPGSPLSPMRSYWFHFDDSNGDLIDTDVPEHSDGPAATALAEYCWNFLIGDIIPEWAQ